MQTSKEESKKNPFVAKSHLLKSKYIDNASSRVHVFRKKEKPSASTPAAFLKSLHTYKNTSRVSNSKMKGKDVSSKIRPLRELMDKNTTVTSKQSHESLVLQSSSKSASENELSSLEELNSTRNMYKVNTANIEHNTDRNFDLNVTNENDEVPYESISSFDKFTKGRQGLQLQKLLQNDEYFKKFVISELLENASHRKKLQSSLMKKHDQFYFDDLPYIDNMESLIQFDNKLKTDKVYKHKVILQMSTVGGSNSKKVVMAILNRIIHCTLAQKYSWTGGKGKIQFSLLKGLVGAVICATRHTKHEGIAFAADTTEEDIIGNIKEFLRQSIGRAKTWKLKHRKEKKQNLPGPETEEDSSIEDEHHEQSETTTTAFTDFEDDNTTTFTENDNDIIGKIDKNISEV